jgi:hypothetical protein
MHAFKTTEGGDGARQDVSGLLRQPGGFEVEPGRERGLAARHFLESEAENDRECDGSEGHHNADGHSEHEISLSDPPFNGAVVTGICRHLGTPLFRLNRGKL